MTTTTQTQQLLYKETTPSSITIEVPETGNIRVNNFSINFDSTYPENLRGVVRNTD